MTTKTDITLPPLPMPIRGSAFVRGHAPDDDRLREWGRAAVEADRQGRMPSDEEILALAESARVWVPMGSGPEKERSLQALRSLIMTALSRYSSGQLAASAEPIEMRGVAETVKAGDGFWRSCSGCHELNEGVPTGPYSSTLKCHLGNGCSECGGIGAIWDTTDYGAMGDFLMHDTAAPVAQEPVYAFRRKGLNEFVTCDQERFAELQAKPHLFETRIFYAAPVAAQAQPSTQDRDDARRYRWLRNESWAGYNTGPSKPRVAETVVITQDGAGNVKTILAEDALDAAIDAARAAKGADHA